MKQECKLDNCTICEHDSNNVILIIDHDYCISEIIINFCPVCGFQPERSKREDHYIGGYFLPPWNLNEHPEKTEGWIAFQEEQRKNPKYYGCGALNIVETQ